MRYANGDMYNGQWKDDKKDGSGTYRYATSAMAEISCNENGIPPGEGAKWSKDRRKAWRTNGGKLGAEISLKEATKIALHVGLPVPQRHQNRGFLRSRSVS